MSDYHICEINEEQNHAQVAFHIPVPDESNGAGINLRTALKQYLERNLEDGMIKSQVPWIDPSELAALQDGNLYEHYFDMEFSNAHDSDLDKRNELDAKYIALVPKIQDKIRNILHFWGLDRDVP